MNLIERVKNIIAKPKQEWLVINSEEATPAGLLTGYLMPLVLAAAAAGGRAGAVRGSSSGVMTKPGAPGRPAK